MILSVQRHIHDTIAAAIRQHFAFGSYVLRDLPADRVMEAVPAQWRAELTDGERSMLRAVAGELLLTEQMLRSGNESEVEDFDSVDEASQSPLDRLVGDLAVRRPRQPRLGDVADYYLSAAEGFRAPLSEYETVSANLRGKYKRSGLGLDVGQYALRVGGAEGMRRAALLTAELRSQSIHVAELAGRLKDASLRNPFNGQPFVWDAADHAIVFDVPEWRKYRRQAYPY